MLGHLCLVVDLGLPSCRLQLTYLRQHLTVSNLCDKRAKSKGCSELATTGFFRKPAHIRFGGFDSLENWCVQTFLSNVSKNYIFINIHQHFVYFCFISVLEISDPVDQIFFVQNVSGDEGR